MIEEFKYIGFTDTGAAETRLAPLVSRGAPGLAANLAAALAEVSDPDITLVRLERFLDAQTDPGAELDRLAATPRYARLACTVFDQSHFLTDIVCRDPDLLRELWDTGVLRRTRARDETIEDLHARLEPARGETPGRRLERAARILRDFKRREILRIAVRDVLMHAPLISLTEDLSNLADAALENALRIAWNLLEQRFGNPVGPVFNRTSRSVAEEATCSNVDLCPDGLVRLKTGPTGDVAFVVIAMGKLGGRELNFSSDIDLVFLYAEEGETAGGSAPPITNAEFFQKIGEQIIYLISESTADGNVFRVDMRLRPHGRMSPLAVSLERAVEYYTEYGQAWERQALIKARPAAGDAGLGQMFIERTRPFVFPRYFDDETLDAIRDVKQQMEAQIADRGETELEVKLGRGGIRDIEFTVQILQMLNGGRMPELRAANTFDAIKALDTRGLLRAFEATALSSNYAFLRRVEHRLQIEGSQQRHVLPAAASDLERFARRLGYVSAAPFMAEYRDRTRETRGILDRFLSTEGAGHLWTYDLLSPHSEGRVGMAHLAQYGFKDPEKARRELILLSAGPPEQPYAFHVRQQFAAVAPTLLEALAACADPDGTLLRLGRILTNLRAPAAIYDTLKGTPALSQYLATLVSNSEFLSEILIRDPGLFDVFSSRDALGRPAARADLEQELENLLGAYDPEAAPYRLRDGAMLRIGVRELLQGASVIDVGRELTDLAEVGLAYALERARDEIVQRYGEADEPFATLALGKLGGREMGYGSDLDLVFVYDGTITKSGMAASEYFAGVAAHAMRRLKESTRYGKLYDIDARLRPDGNKGVLAVSLRRIEEYYLEEAQPWERLALIKVRAVAGDVEFAARVEALMRDLAFSLELTRDTLDQIEAIRAKIVQNASPRDLKKHEGGIGEIEFVVRLLQLEHAARHPELRRGDVLGALEILAEHRLFSEESLSRLRETYLLFRRVENRLRMMHGRSESTMPESAAELAELAQRLDLPEDLGKIIDERKGEVHRIYESLRADLAQDR